MLVNNINRKSTGLPMMSQTRCMTKSNRSSTRQLRLCVRCSKNSGLPSRFLRKDLILDLPSLVRSWEPSTRQADSKLHPQRGHEHLVEQDGEASEAAPEAPFAADSYIDNSFSSAKNPRLQMNWLFVKRHLKKCGEPTSTGGSLLTTQRNLGNAQIRSPHSLTI